MEGRKFSSSRNVVIYVRDFLARYSPDTLRYYLTAAGPETNDTDFTWSEFLRRNNDELVAAWGNLVNRTLSFTAKNIGTIPAAGELLPVDQDLLKAHNAVFTQVGHDIEHSRMRSALGGAMGLVTQTNKYLSDEAPWKLRESDPERMNTILHVALQLVGDCTTLLSPFMPHSSQQVHELLGLPGVLAAQPELREVDDLDGGPAYPILTGDYQTGAHWGRTALTPGTVIAPPTPLFAKLDPSVVDEELARMADE
jgi:methionyl-tRNA synthetase